MKSKKRILIYGGSFDPPHLGHLKTACAVQRAYEFDRFIFVPCKQSVLKNKSLATGEQRFEMLKLALAPYLNAAYHFEIDKRELERETPSYMLETLESFQRDDDKHSASFTLLLGTDAFQNFTRWHQWENILKLCDLLIMQRADIHQNKSIPQNLKTAISTSCCQLQYIEAGHYPIASSTLRQRIHEGESLEKNLLSEAVYDYIKTNHLYQPLQNHR